MGDLWFPSFLTPYSFQPFSKTHWFRLPNSTSPVFWAFTVTTLGQSTIIALTGNKNDILTGHGTLLPTPSPSNASSRGQFLKAWGASVRSQDFILSALGATEGSDINNLYHKEISLASLWEIKCKGQKVEGRPIRRQSHFSARLPQLSHTYSLAWQPLPFSLCLQHAKPLTSLRWSTAWNACLDVSTAGSTSFSPYPLRELSRPGGSNYSCSQTSYLSPQRHKVGLQSSAPGRLVVAAWPALANEMRVEAIYGTTGWKPASHCVFRHDFSSATETGSVPDNGSSTGLRPRLRMMVVQGRILCQPTDTWHEQEINLP